MDSLESGPLSEVALRTLWYDLMHVAGMAAFTLGFSMRYEGTRHMPKTGPVLVIANHQSFLDPWLVGLAVQRRLTYLARKTLFRNRLFAALIRSLNAVPIDQEGVGKEGLKTVVAQLRHGKAVLVFPEGTRTPDGTMQPLRPGIHLLLKRARARIVPVGIAGAYDAWPIWRAFPVPAPLFMPARPGTVAIAVGSPMDSQRFSELSRENVLAELSSALQAIQARAEALRRR